MGHKLSLSAWGTVLTRIGVPRLPASEGSCLRPPAEGGSKPPDKRNQALHMEAGGGGGGRWRNSAATALDALMNYLISPPHCGSMSGG